MLADGSTRSFTTIPDVATDPGFCADTGWACGPVYDATHNETLARVVG